MEYCRRLLMLLAGVALALAVAAAEPTVLKEWRFDTPADSEGWVAANHISELTVADGALQGRIDDWDPFLIGPRFELPVTPWQVVEVRLRTDDGGIGELFWTNTTETEYQGFSPGKETGFDIIGDGQWHEYRIYPYWQAEGQIILIRLDFPRVSAPGKTFAVDWVRIVDLGAQVVTTATSWDFTQGLQGWSARGQGSVEQTPEGLRFRAAGDDFQLVSPPLQVSLEDRMCLFAHLRVASAPHGLVLWASGDHPGIRRMRFRLRDDSRWHCYNLDMAADSFWSGQGMLLGLSFPAGSNGTLRTVSFADRPQGPADVELVQLVPENALNRVGRDVPLVLDLRNHGGEAARDLRIARVEVPEGVEVGNAGEAAQEIKLPGGQSGSYRLVLWPDKPVSGKVAVSLSGPGAPEGAIACDLTVTPSLNLPRAEYVPEPRPVQSDYEIGAFYFPGWHSPASWEPIRRVAPIRKPVLGWYDESNPECVDWQIKWAVENGIQVFYVDWYWSAGGQSLDHWVKAYQKARYRRYLKWCVMWANHNAPDTHSEADQRAVTQWWIDNYFSMPEYYRIDDKPVVIMWAPGNLERDMGGPEGAKRLLDISQEMAREAGYKGIYFIAMCGDDAEAVQRMKDEGYEMTSIYHYMGHGGKAEDPQHFGFDLVAESNYDHWQSLQRIGVLPFLPNLATGWDSTPWHGDAATAITGRTVPLFRRICEDAKRFAEETGIRRLALAPLNEWGEGSYAEPNLEFGFGMYETVREVFCRKPPAGWPVNHGPQDVGLGPYDYPAMTQGPRTSWDFSDDAQGWGPSMGIADFRVADGALHFTTASTDPALGLAGFSLNAWNLQRLTVRMRLEGLPDKDDSAQLFWTTGTNYTEGLSVRFPLARDGQWHDYVVDLGANRRWRGIVRSFRFDPCSSQGVRVSVDEVRFD